MSPLTNNKCISTNFREWIENPMRRRSIRLYSSSRDSDRSYSSSPYVALYASTSSMLGGEGRYSSSPYVALYAATSSILGGEGKG